MVAIHPIVAELLDPLLQSPLSELARLVISRIESEAEEHGADDGPRVTRQEGFEQVEQADDVIVGLLRRELNLISANQRLIGELRVRDDGPMFTSLVAVTANGDGPPVLEYLLSPARAEALIGLLQAWKEGVLDARLRLERERDGL